MAILASDIPHHDCRESSRAIRRIDTRFAKNTHVNVAKLKKITNQKGFAVAVFVVFAAFMAEMPPP